VAEGVAVGVGVDVRVAVWDLLIRGVAVGLRVPEWVNVNDPVATLVWLVVGLHVLVGDLVNHKVGDMLTVCVAVGSNDNVPVVVGVGVGARVRM
jgi:hypothetical protein